MDDEELAYLPDIYHECIENQTEKIFKSITKGGEKVRPYLEVKVVKVKKPKPKLFMCKVCGTILPAEKPKGNWVNGENLDKIKFPCFCSYVLNDMKWYGEINCSWQDFQGYTFYLSNINEQKNTNLVEENGSIKDLIKKYNIHILKGKIILFEEE